MENTVIGFLATSTSVLAFSSQFVFTLKSKTTTGISLYRTVLDVVSLALWIAYATRLEDIPLLIATSCEITTSLGLLVLIVVYNKNSRFTAVTDFTPPSTPPNTEDFTIVEIKPGRRNSV
jgi:uncharacterized protein with PQ loop repeat